MNDDAADPSRWRSLRARRHRRAAQRARVARALLSLGVVLVGGVVGHLALASPAPTFADALHATAVAIATVGHVDPLLHGAAPGFLLTLAIAGLGATAYLVLAGAALLVAADLERTRRGDRVKARVATLSGHVIVCGAGRSGAQVVREILALGLDLVVIEEDPAALAALAELGHADLITLQADALRDTTLMAAGVERARSLVATLRDDRDNLFLCVNARQLNPDIRIIAKSDGRASVAKFAAVGADRVVSPASLGGQRIAAELLRAATYRDEPHPADDPLPHARALIVRELPIEADAPLAGFTLHDAQLPQDLGCVIIGLREPSEDGFRYHPDDSARLVPGGAVLAVGRPEQLTRVAARLVRRAATTAPAPSTADPSPPIPSPKDPS